MRRIVSAGLLAAALLCAGGAAAQVPGTGAPAPTLPTGADRVRAALAGMIADVEQAPLTRERIRSLAGQFRALGPAAAEPILAVVDPASRDLAALRATHPARAARFEAVLLDAVGRLENPIAAPAFRAALDRAEPEVARAAARGLGKLCRAEDLAFLAAHPSDAALEGLGFCRRAETGAALVRALAGAGARVAEVARAAGNWGSSWAWQALGPEASAASLQARGEVAAALVAALPRTEGEARREVERAILLLELPQTDALLQGIEAVAPESVARIRAGLRRR